MTRRQAYGVALVLMALFELMFLLVASAGANHGALIFYMVVLAVIFEVPIRAMADAIIPD